MPNTKGAGGRPRKPTAELKRDGTYRPDRHADRSDLCYERSTPTKPEGLGEHGGRLWDQVVDYTPPDVFRIMDTTKLTMCCRLWQQWVELDALIAAGSREAKDWNLWLKVGAEWAKLSSEFGIGPVSRARIKIQPPPASADSPLSRLQGILSQRN